MKGVVVVEPFTAYRRGVPRVSVNKRLLRLHFHLIVKIAKQIISQPVKFITLLDVDVWSGVLVPNSGSAKTQSSFMGIVTVLQISLFAILVNCDMSGIKTHQIRNGFFIL